METKESTSCICMMLLLTIDELNKEIPPKVATPIPPNKLENILLKPSSLTDNLNGVSKNLKSPCKLGN